MAKFRNFDDRLRQEIYSTITPKATPEMLEAARRALSGEELPEKTIPSVTIGHIPAAKTTINAVQKKYPWYQPGRFRLPFRRMEEKPVPEIPPASESERFLTIGPAPEPTGWQKFKQFFTTDRPPLPPNADRMEYFDRAFDIAIGSPLRVFLKYSKGRMLNLPDLVWAGLKKITPDSMWEKEVKKMNLDQAMDWVAGYDPSGFQKTVGELAEFVSRLQTAKKIGQATGILGTKETLPKDITKLIRAGEAAKLWGLAAMGREFSKGLAEKIEYPGDRAVIREMMKTRTTEEFDAMNWSDFAKAAGAVDYGYEGAVGVIRDMGIGFGLSLAVSTLIKPALAKVAQSAMGKRIIDAANRVLIDLSKKFPQTMDAIRKNPEKYFVEKTKEYLKYRGIDPEGLAPQQKAVIKHIAREGQRRFLQAYKNYTHPDVVYRKPPPPLRITGKEPLITPTPTAPVPTMPEITPSKPVEARKPPEGVELPPEAPVKPEAKAVEGKKYYTSIPEEWRGETDLYSWGRQGLRSKGNRKIGKRKTFIWESEFEKVPVRIPPSTIKTLKERTDEIFKIHIKKGEDYYIAPPQVVKEVKAELGEDAFKQRPKSKRSPLQIINDVINREIRHKEFTDAQIGAIVEGCAKEFGLIVNELTANQKRYIEVLNNDPEANIIRKSFNEGIEQAFRPTEEEIEERLGIQEQGIAENIGDFLDGIIEVEEALPEAVEGKPEAKAGMIPREIWQTKEFTEGKLEAIAWGDKVGVAKNPYKENTPGWMAWNRGWNTYEPPEAPPTVVEAKPAPVAEIPPRPLVNPKATAIQQDKQLIAQQKWDKKYGKAGKQRKLLSANQISDFEIGRDKVIREADKTYVIDTQGAREKIQVISDVLTPEFATNIQKLSSEQKNRMIEEIKRTPYLSEEGKTERLALLSKPTALPKAVEEIAATVPPVAPPVAPPVVPPAVPPVAPSEITPIEESFIERVRRRAEEALKLGKVTVTPKSLVPLEQEAVTKLKSAVKLSEKERKVIEQEKAEYQRRRLAQTYRWLKSEEAKKLTPAERLAETVKFLKGEQYAKQRWSPIKFDQLKRNQMHSYIEKHPGLGLHTKRETSAALEKLFNGYYLQNHEAAYIMDVFPELGKVALGRRPPGNKFYDYFSGIIGLPKATLAALDISAVGRQLAFLELVYPSLIKPAYTEATKLFWRLRSEEYAIALEAEMRKDPFWQHAVDVGTEVTRRGATAISPTELEEKFPSRFVSEIPFIERSERAFTPVSNLIRVGALDLAETIARDAGMPLSLEDQKATAKAINDLSGRPSLPAGLRHLSQLLSTTFFSPRLLISRPKVIGKAFFARNPSARKLIARGLSGVAAFSTSLLLLAKLAHKYNDDIDSELHPLSGDFGKVIYKNQHIDATFGLGPVIRTVARVATGLTKTQAGEIKRLSPDALEARIRAFMQYLRTKESPFVSFAKKVLTRKNWLGQRAFQPPKGTVGEWMKKMGIPKPVQIIGKELYETFMFLPIQDVVEAGVIDGWISAIIAAPLAYHGITTMTYAPSEWTELKRLQNSVAREQYKKDWDELLPKQQEDLRRLNDEKFEEFETKLAQARLEEKSDYETEEEYQTRQYFKRSLPKDVQEEFYNIGLNPSGISRKIGDWYLTDRRYEIYKEEVLRLYNKEISKRIRSKGWKDKKRKVKIRILRNLMDIQKEKVRMNLTRGKENERLQ